MIEYKTGNIFTTEKQTIVNTVNTVGVMGAGLALIHKAMFPKMFQQYKSYCKDGLFNVGQLWLYTKTNRWNVLNFPTKRHWKDRSEISIIEIGLTNLVKTYRQRGITSLAIPLLGCHNGGLNEETVLPVMVRYLDQMEIPIEIWKNDWNIPNPIWEELYTACESEDTTFKRIVRQCSCFEDLVKMPGVGKDTFGKEVNKIIQYEKDQ